MGRTSSQSLVVLGVLLMGQQLGSGSTPLASPTARASVLTADERATLLRYAKDTWRSFEKLTLPSGLPADSLSSDGEGWSNPLFANIADEHRRLSLEHLGRRAAAYHRPFRSQVTTGQDPRDVGRHGA